MGMEIEIDSLEDMCALMCDNVIPERKKRITREETYYEKEIEDLQKRLDIAQYDNERLQEEVTELKTKLDALNQGPKTGFWVETDGKSSPYCSECHTITYKWPYCPICGSYNEGVKKEYFDGYAEIARAIEIDAIPRKILKHRLYERYIDSPTEFKELAALLDDIMHVMKYNAEAYDNSQKM